MIILTVRSLSFFIFAEPVLPCHLPHSWPHADIRYCHAPDSWTITAIQFSHCWPYAAILCQNSDLMLPHLLRCWPQCDLTVCHASPYYCIYRIPDLLYICCHTFATLLHGHMRPHHLPHSWPHATISFATLLETCWHTIVPLPFNYFPRILAFIAHSALPPFLSESSTGDTLEDWERETTCWRERGEWDGRA